MKVNEFKSAYKDLIIEQFSIYNDYLMEVVFKITMHSLNMSFEKTSNLHAIDIELFTSMYQCYDAKSRMSYS